MEDQKIAVIYDSGVLNGTNICMSRIETNLIDHLTKYSAIQPLDKILDEYYEKILFLEGEKINLQIENDLLKSKLDEIYYRRGVSY